MTDFIGLPHMSKSAVHIRSWRCQWRSSLLKTKRPGGRKNSTAELDLSIRLSGTGSSWMVYTWRFYNISTLILIRLCRSSCNQEQRFRNLYRCPSLERQIQMGYERNTFAQVSTSYCGFEMTEIMCTNYMFQRRGRTVPISSFHLYLGKNGVWDILEEIFQC